MSAESEACLVYITGKARVSFRCDCGCNVFNNHGSDPAVVGELYECNACGELYEGT